MQERCQHAFPSLLQHTALPWAGAQPQGRVRGGSRRAEGRNTAPNSPARGSRHDGRRLRHTACSRPSARHRAVPPLSREPRGPRPLPRRAPRWRRPGPGPARSPLRAARPRHGLRQRHRGVLRRARGRAPGGRLPHAVSPLPCPAIPCPALLSLPALSAALGGDVAAPSAEVRGSRGCGALPLPCGPPAGCWAGRGPCSAGGCLRGGEETGKGMRGTGGALGRLFWGLAAGVVLVRW